MALTKNLLEVDPVSGIAIGLGALLVWPVLSRVGRPLAKEAIKGGMRLYRASASAVGALNELVTEAQADATAEPHPASPPLSGRPTAKETGKARS